MAYYPNRQFKSPRQFGSPQPGSRSQNDKWMVWCLLGLGLVVALAVIAWRLQVRDELRAKEKQVSALLVSADELILSNREDDAEAEMRKAFTLIPGDPRCQAVIERINKKREMIREKMETASKFAMEQAEMFAQEDIAAAKAAYDRIRLDKTLTPEAMAAAKVRIEELSGKVCSLRLPADWPTDAVLSIDDVVQSTEKNPITGISPGKHKVQFKRFGFREPPAVELEFRGLTPVPLPAIQWLPRGTKVSVVSRPTGASVWQNGKDTGKVTPCDFEDVEIGQIEFLLKHPDHADTVVTREVKDRTPVRLSVTLEPPSQ
jgi:PEGA domain